MASRLVWAKNLDTLRFSYQWIVVRYKPLTVCCKKMLFGSLSWKNCKKKESLSIGIVSFQLWFANSACRRAASHWNGGDSGVDGGTSSCNIDAGGAALQCGHDGHNFLSCCTRNHCDKHSMCINFLQHIVFSSGGHALAQIAHSWSSIT